MKLLFLFLLWMPVFGQTELFLPWVPQNETFLSIVVVNNYNDETVQVTLKAARSFSQIEEKTVEIGPFSSLQSTALNLFPNLGEGSGSLVTITSDAANLTASVIISSTTTESGNSPSQMNAIPATKASTTLAYHHLPIVEDGFSAPVIANIGTSPAVITFHGFKDGQEIGTSLRNVLPGEVFARETREMFPGTEGGLYVVAKSNQPMVGASFVFNGLREPALAAAEPVQDVPDPFNTIVDISISSESITLEADETQALQASANYLQGPSQDVTEQAQWSSLNPDIASISNGGPNKGTVTAKSPGTTKVRATLDDFSSEVEIEVLFPDINLTFGSLCFFTPESCISFSSARVPFILQRTLTSLLLENNNQVPIQFFRISPDAPITISEIESQDLNGHTQVSVSGIREGQVISPGQVINFSLNAAKTNTEDSELIYEIKERDRGTIIRMRFFYRTN